MIRALMSIAAIALLTSCASLGQLQRGLPSVTARVNEQQVDTRVNWQPMVAYATNPNRQPSLRINVDGWASKPLFPGDTWAISGGRHADFTLDTYGEATTIYYDFRGGRIPVDNNDPRFGINLPNVTAEIPLTITVIKLIPRVIDGVYMLDDDTHQFISDQKQYTWTVIIRTAPGWR